MYERIRIAAVGLGWVTQHRHLPVLARNERFEVVGVVDRHPGRAREVAASGGHTHYAQADSLKDIPWLDGVDAVTIGTSPFSHYELAHQALSAGKHVITEKPFTMAPDEARALRDLARDKGLVLAVVHNFQFASSTRSLLRDMQEGRLGEITTVLAVQLGNPRRRLPLWYEELPLGLFYDESPHFFYLLRRLCGELRLVQCSIVPKAERNTPSMVQALYTCRLAGQRVPVSMLLNFESPVSEWHLAVCGTKALGSVDIFRDIYTRLPNDGEHSTTTVVRTSAAATLQHWAQHFTSGVRHLTGRLFYGNEEVFERFGRAIREGGRPTGVDAEDGLEVVVMQHEVLSKSKRAEPE